MLENGRPLLQLLLGIWAKLDLQFGSNGINETSLHSYVITFENETRSRVERKQLGNRESARLYAFHTE